jgi:hypothetical protein
MANAFYGSKNLRMRLVQGCEGERFERSRIAGQRSQDVNLSLTAALRHHDVKRRYSSGTVIGLESCSQRAGGRHKQNHARIGADEELLADAGGNVESSGDFEMPRGQNPPQGFERLLERLRDQIGNRCWYDGHAVRPQKERGSLNATFRAANLEGAVLLRFAIGRETQL